MKNLYKFIFCLFGVYLGRVLYVFLDNVYRPEKYIANSAPWYTGVLAEGIFFLFIVIVVLIIAYILKWKSQKNKS